MTDNAVRLTYQQYRAVRRLVHDCCNYQDGNCLLLDDGEECVCPQSISYSLICRWFRAAVLPLDENLCAALLHRRERKKCVLWPLRIVRGGFPYISFRFSKAL